MAWLVDSAAAAALKQTSQTVHSRSLESIIHVHSSVQAVSGFGSLSLQKAFQQFLFGVVGVRVVLGTNPVMKVLTFGVHTALKLTINSYKYYREMVEWQGGGNSEGGL